MKASQNGDILESDIPDDPALPVTVAKVLIHVSLIGFEKIVAPFTP
jgi:hypothetical protein